MVTGNLYCIYSFTQTTQMMSNLHENEKCILSISTEIMDAFALTDITKLMLIKEQNGTTEAAVQSASSVSSIDCAISKVSKTINHQQIWKTYVNRIVFFSSLIFYCYK